MPNPIIRIHNVETDEIIDREMTAAEFKQYKENLAQIAAENNASAQKAAEKVALLERLGITAEEAALLLG